MSSHKDDKEESEELKDGFLKNVVNPYLNEVKTHPKVLRLEDGVLQQEDLQGPKKEGDTKARLEYLWDVFMCKDMVLRGLDANHRMISELIAEHKKETEGLRDDILSLYKEISQLQAQIYDLHNQNCEYEGRFKRISSAASFRMIETEMSLIDGKPLPWKFDDTEGELESANKE